MTLKGGRWDSNWKMGMAMGHTERWQMGFKPQHGNGNVTEFGLVSNTFKSLDLDWWYLSVACPSRVQCSSRIFFFMIWKMQWTHQMQDSAVFWMFLFFFFFYNFMEDWNINLDYVGHCLFVRTDWLNLFLAPYKCFNLRVEFLSWKAQVQSALCVWLAQSLFHITMLFTKLRNFCSWGPHNWNEPISKLHKRFPPPPCTVWRRQMEKPHQGVDALWDFIWNIFIFLAALKSQQMPNHSNTWSCQTTSGEYSTTKEKRHGQKKQNPAKLQPTRRAKSEIWMKQEPLPTRAELKTWDSLMKLWSVSILLKDTGASHLIRKVKIFCFWEFRIKHEVTGEIENFLHDFFFFFFLD